MAPVRIIGLLSWYEENPSWLAACVTSAAAVCDHIIAVDGPYAMFPGAIRKPASGVEQAETIAQVAAAAGIGCTIHTPRQPWWGNEVGKRDFMFRLGALVAEPDRDWFMRIDADEVIAGATDQVRERLASTELDVAEVTLTERGDVDSHSPLRIFFRALPGIGVQQAHYVVTAPTDDRVKVLAGNHTVHRLEPAETLWDARLEHRTRHRTPERKAAKADYYGQLPEIEQVQAL